MAGSEARAGDIAGLHAGGPAENLLIEQFRYWMSGHASCRSRHWTLAWKALAARLDCASAKLLFTELHHFTRILCENAVRSIEWLPGLGRCISRDEGLVLALVQASQVDETHIEIAAASELLGSFRVEALIAASRSLARALGTSELCLEPIEAVSELPPTTCLGLGHRTLH